MTEAEPRTWPEINAWRKAERVRLMAARGALGPGEHRAASRVILDQVAHAFPELGARLIGFYWPIRRELDPLPLIRRLIAAGGAAALPMVVGRGKPLEFRRWTPGATMAIGVYDITYPADGPGVEPEVMHVPHQGFDEAGYRLGYGAGYYDRTIASFARKPFLIGIGFELGRLATIFPQPHDIPMDVVITEHRLFRRVPG